MTPPDSIVPRFRRFIASHVGQPFFAAIPNRDFLIAWATDCEPGFHQLAREQVARSFNERPYALQVTCSERTRAWSNRGPSRSARVPARDKNPLDLNYFVPERLRPTGTDRPQAWADRT